MNANSSTIGGQNEQTNKDGVLPVVIRQLLLVEENVEMFGLSYALIETVALVRGIEYSATKITYHLEDHSGQIDAHYWLEGDDQANHPQLTVNCYARLVGSLRVSSESKVIVVYHAEEVLDPNVVTSHLLEVMYVRYKAEAYKKRGVRSTYSTVGGTAMDTSEPVRVGANAVSGGGGGGFGGDSTNPYALSPKNLLIFNAIKDEGGSIGMGRKQLEQKFSHMSKEEIAASLDFMVNEGIVYTSIDPDHYLPVE